MMRERFDIQAKIPNGVSKNQVPEMLQALLAERFKLAFHHDRKTQSVYGLVVARDGPRSSSSLGEILVPDSPESRTFDSSQGTFRIDSSGLTTAAGPAGRMRETVGADGSLHIELSSVTMPAWPRCSRTTRTSRYST
jgi:uncharacterized protein (TIGR03435 family)